MSGTIFIAALFASVLAAASPVAAGSSESVITPTAERAASFSTGDLVAACASESGPEGRSTEFCEGFILGTGLLYLELRRARMIDAWACAGSVPTLRQLRQDFVGWARDNPEHLDEAAVDGFWRAMAETYPCSTP